jgi:hypothetical protein
MPAESEQSEEMAILRLLRWTLLASVLLWAALLVLLTTEIGPPDLLALLSITASLMIVISACACVIAQLLVVTRRTKRLRTKHGDSGIGDG